MTGVGVAMIATHVLSMKITMNIFKFIRGCGLYQLAEPIATEANRWKQTEANTTIPTYIARRQLPPLPHTTCSYAPWLVCSDAYSPNAVCYSTVKVV